MDSKTVINAKEMLYKFLLASAEGKQYRFFGKKIIKADKVGETGLTDTTTLFVDIFDGHNEGGPIVASGVLKIGAKDFKNQLDSMEVINTDSTLVQIKWVAKFCNFFAKTIWRVYSGLAECTYLDPDSPPRMKRPLRLGNATPVIYKVLTEDNVSMLFIIV